MSEEEKGIPAMTLPTAQSVKQLTPEHLAMVMEGHFQALAVGIAHCNPFIPQPAIWDAIATGMGRVLSGVTQSSDLKATFEARGRLGDLVNVAIRKAYPALAPASHEAVSITNGKGGMIHPVPPSWKGGPNDRQAL